jgi:hypothetical protein
VTRQRRSQITKAALRECAEIVESAIGVDLGIYESMHLTKEESDLVEATMRRVSDALYKKAER